jgi:hypothetical protein
VRFLSLATVPTDPIALAVTIVLCVLTARATERAVVAVWRRCHGYSLEDVRTIYGAREPEKPKA